MSCVLHSISLSTFAVAMQLIAKDIMFVCLHGKQNVCLVLSTLLLNRRNTPVSTRRSVSIAQWLEPWPSDPVVVGSSPDWGGYMCPPY